MTRAVVIGGSLGGLTAALVLRDQGWEVDILERSPNPLERRGTGIVVHPTTVRYLVERVGKPIGDIGLPPSSIRYLGADGSIAHEQPCAYRFASYFELYRGLLDAFGTERYHLSNELAHLDNRDDAAVLSLSDGWTFTTDLVVCADGIRSAGRRIMVPEARPRYAGMWPGAAPLTVPSSAVAQRACCWMHYLPNLLGRPRADLSDTRPGRRRAVQLALVSEPFARTRAHGPAHRP